MFFINVLGLNTLVVSETHNDGAKGGKEFLILMGNTNTCERNKGRNFVKTRTKARKSLLNMAALSAKKNDKEIGDYYKRKVAEGKHKMLVQNNIRCKVLSRIFAVVTRESAWVDTQKFAA